MYETVVRKCIIHTEVKQVEKCAELRVTSFANFRVLLPNADYLGFGHTRAVRRITPVSTQSKRGVFLLQHLPNSWKQGYVCCMGTVSTRSRKE